MNGDERKDSPKAESAAEDREKNGSFRYTYSAPTSAERREIEGIRRQYSPSAETGVERLKKLDRQVKRFPQIAAISLGTVGVLIFGLGLCMILEWQMTLQGIFVAIPGAAATAAAYPVHQALLARGKRKHGAEILRLSDELLGGNDPRKE